MFELNLEGRIALSWGRCGRRDGISKGTGVGKSQISGAQSGCILNSPSELLKPMATQALPSRDPDVTGLGWGPNTGIY